jgi:hypothetical protein
VTSPWDPLGRALLAYQEGQHDAEILVESDLFETDDPDACQPRTAQLQRGEVRFRLRFREFRGSWYRWLFCPEEELRTVALRTGWTTEILRRGDRAAYIARLRSTDRVIL